ncbi:MAG: NYN domain-containing protein [Candidatus Manganitrophus sp.]|nr:NYN domain-containing protein [Candidatus Manganitrophus sp.]
MATSEGTFNMAVFCDLENVAIGVRDARYAQFDIEKVLERLLLKGNIVVKKAYCDWERYKDFKGGMHEAAFELIEIPHIRQSGKNSADIRMVVDALDLCYTKSHIDSFVVVSGDSDFSPLVSKLRENNKNVIGVGVKKSTSDLLISNCDEFIFYDDLVRETVARRKPKTPRPAAKTPAVKTDVKTEVTKDDEEKKESKRQEALNLVLETVEAIFNERGERKVWGSMVKQTLRRRKPGFNESYYGFRNFNQLLEEAEKRKLLILEKDQTSGGFIVLDFGPEWTSAEAEEPAVKTALSCGDVHHTDRFRNEPVSIRRMIAQAFSPLSFFPASVKLIGDDKIVDERSGGGGGRGPGPFGGPREGRGGRGGAPFSRAASRPARSFSCGAGPLYPGAGRLAQAIGGHRSDPSPGAVFARCRSEVGFRLHALSPRSKGDHRVGPLRP